MKEFNKNPYPAGTDIECDRCMNVVRKGVWYHHCAQCFTDLCINCPGINEEDAPKVKLPLNKQPRPQVLAQAPAVAKPTSIDVINKIVIQQEEERRKREESKNGEPSSEEEMSAESIAF